METQSIIPLYKKRRDALREHIIRAGLEGLLVTMDANRFYLSGFELHDSQFDESSGYLAILANGDDWLYTDSRYHEAAAEVWDRNYIHIYGGKGPEMVGEHLNTLLGSKNIGYDGRHISVDDFECFALASPVRHDNLVEKLRVIKDASEIEAMKASCAINEKMMVWLPDRLIPGKTEAQLAWEIEQFFRNNGAEELAFSSIVAIDERGALPHAIPGSKKLTDNCAVLVDVGCRYNNYCSDQTRTFWVGDTPAPFFTENLEKVQKAQQKAIEAIAPGKLGKDIYAIARNSLEADGVAEYFTHGLGHGVGLQTHEAPRFSPLDETVLEPGMVITVEPGVYFAGKLGIRWEHMALVTETGYEIL